jgi:phage head maturation protease
MAKGMYIDTLQIEREAEGSDDFAVFEGVMTSMQLNTKYFRWSLEALREIVRQANTGNGAPIFPLHDTFREFNIGRTRSARVRNEQGLVTLDIQRGLQMGNTTTDDLISRMVAGTVDSLSTGTIGGDFICDLDGSKFEFNSDGFFFYMRQCGEGHRLGESVRYDGKNQDVTATVKGKPRLLELSVVGSGAIPDAKITKRLGEMLSADEIHPNDLHLISEINGFHFHNLTEQLGVAPVLPFDNNPDPDPIALSKDPKGDDSMAANKTLIEQENEALSTQVETLTAEKAEIQRQLDAGCTAEEAEALESQLEDTKIKLKTATDKITEDEKSVKDGKVALDYLHAEAKRYHVSAYFPNDDPTPEELSDLESTIADTSPSELTRSIKRLKAKTFENREGGRKSKSSTPANTTQPKGYTRSSV